MLRTVRTVGASERVTQRTTAAAARLALHREVQFGQVLALQLQSAQILVGLGAARAVLGLKSLGETAGAVLAGAALLARLGGALGR